MNLQLLPGGLPAGYCYPADPQQFYNDIFSLGVAILSDTLGGVVVSNTAPALGGTAKVWVRTSGGSPVNPLVWVPYNGVWAAPHPEPPNSKKRAIWVGTLADLYAFDGGDGTDPAVSPPTNITGAMWQADTTNFAAKIPIGVGTLPSTRAVAVLGTLGEEQHTLTVPEIPPHQHDELASGTPGNRNGVQAANDLAPVTAQFLTAPGGGNADGSTSPHENMPPVVGVYFIYRTARLYYDATKWP